MVSDEHEVVEQATNRTPPDDVSFPDRMLSWFEVNGRHALPWRHSRDAWSILVAEVMLQQTGVDRVVPRWSRFLERWPDVGSCSEATMEDLLAEWSGLGYPRRVRNLRAAAQIVVAEYEGVMPDDLDGLLRLPGVGPYTARAVMAFAFERDVAVLDTNVGRILARRSGRRLSRGEAQSKADAAVPVGAGWAWNQAVLDFGAMVCRKTAPRCGTCPVSSTCAWRSEGPDPAESSAAVSRTQAPYKGSDRQLRGEILRRLQASPTPRRQLMADLGSVWTQARVELALDSLIADGFVAVEPTLRIAE